MAVNTLKTGVLMAALFGLFMLIGRALGGMRAGISSPNIQLRLCGSRVIS